MSAVPEKSHACLLIRFEGMASDVCVPNEQAFLRGIEQLAPTWKYTCTPIQGEACDLPKHWIAKVSNNTQHPGTFNIESIYLDEPLLGLPTASALCALLADVLEAHIEESQNPIALHAGAFAIGHRLVAVTGPGRAGKSTLISRLCAEPDLQIFCDDVLPISPQGEGVALGVAPRLRLPLPATANLRFKQFVKRHLGPHDNRYGYLCTNNVAPHGTRLPLGAIVVLDRRQDDTTACLHTMNEDDALFYALEQNMGNFESPAEALTATQTLLGKITCVRLTYSNLEEAVQLLKKAFGGEEAIDPDLQVKPAQDWVPSAPETEALAAPEQVFKRTPTAALRRVGQSAFLWQAGEHTIWRLNTVGQAVWALLEIPGNAKELAHSLAEVYVQTKLRDIEMDVRKVLALMHDQGFITAD